MARVWIVAWFANRAGGADVYTENLAVGLAGRGHRVTVVCYDASPKVQSVCRVVRIPQPSHSRWPVLWRAAPALIGPHWAWYLSHVSGPLPDIAVYSPASIRAALASRLPDVPLVYLPHAMISPVEVAGTLGGQPSRFLRWVGVRTQFLAERDSLRKAAMTVRFSRAAVDAMQCYYRLNGRARFEVIPMAVDAPVRQAKPPPRQELRLLAIGRLIASKNIGLLLSHLANCLDLPWKLDVVGDGPERPALETHSVALDLRDRVAFHGHQTGVGEFYATADLLAFPSRLESFGLVTLEAMAHGVPALVIRADGLKYLNVHHEVIRDHVDGMIAADEAHFGYLLRSCIADPGGVRRMGIAAREAAAKHTWPAALDRWERLLGELATSRRKRAAW